MTSALAFGQVTEGRTSTGLRYLERKSDSDTLTFFFHGLGLDATDYLGYLSHTDTHGIALNLRGYEPDRSAGIPPVPLASHIRLAASFVEQVSRENAGKEVVLLGFSLGADLILQLAEHWQSGGRGEVPTVRAALLLDPNVNQSTMTISRLFAEADPTDPVSAFKELVNLAPDKDGFRSLCHYLAKVAPKDFGQVRQLSRDMITYWRPDGYDQFGARLHNVTRVAEHVRLVLSASYGEHLSAMRAAMGRHGDADTVSVELTGVDHFDLIDEDRLTSVLAPFTG
ncbi:alpha/beta fold hydrolase [Streptomyces sp. BR123]|jgi:pimeloyl-ACP methyl ester carboxylesterase|uniref:alpha/beta fold hydrolase n=1 Tax=Streptomyces sp. BR123 TaxID=2749828 RepID=UPI0015C43E60|nr:alpha/beta fold hydrolase [Streptomyces sp. BR123]NXY96677.1 alpha/beta fold hydrolase [Streptomyces sp. BR123]